MSRLVIGARGSALATWQANFVRDAILAARPELTIELKTITTSGDSGEAISPTQQGVFTKEIERELLAGRVDLAVHSLKDLPTRLTDGLAVAAVPAREDAADVLIAKSASSLADLPAGGTILTGSPRRRGQLLHRRADLAVAPVRGNIETRLRKLDESAAEGMILARAGLVRLGLEGRIACRLDPTDFLPACGQGALAVEVRAGDGRVEEIVAALDDPPSRLAVTAERAFLAAIAGGCRAPAGAYGRFDGAEMTLTGMVASLDGRDLLRETVAAPVADTAAAEALGRELSQALIGRGASDIIQSIAAGEETSESDR